MGERPERTMVSEVRDHYAMLVEAAGGTSGWAREQFDAALAEVWDGAREATYMPTDPAPPTNPYRPAPPVLVCPKCRRAGNARRTMPTLDGTPVLICSYCTGIAVASEWGAL